MKKAIRVVALVALVFLFSVAAYYIYDVLRVRSLNEKMAEIIHLEDRRKLTRQLTEYLENESWELRQRAALAVGRIGGSGAGEALMPLLSDSSLDVARTAAFAIGLTGEKELASGLLEYAFELPSSVGASAVEAAGRLADSSMTDVILNLQEFFGHPSPDVRDAACRAAFLAGARSLSNDLIELATNEPDEIVQVAALYTLARLKIDEAGEAYVKFLAHYEPSVRTWAIRGLSNSSHPQAEHYLAIALNDGSNRVVAQAVSELGKKKTLQARQQLARRFKSEQDEKLVVSLLDALRQQDNDASIDYALRLLEDEEPSDNIVAAVIRYLAAVQKDRAVNLIDSLQMTAEVTVRAACADAYQIIGHSNGIPRVAVLFNDEDPVVRASAFSALLKIDSANTEFYVGKAMNDQDMVLNVLAIDEIGKGRVAKYRSTLAELMTDRETDLDVRRALVDAAGQFLDADSADTLMLQLVINGLLDHSYVVRRETAEVYERITGKDRSDRVPPAETRASVGQIKSLLDSFDELRPPYATIVTNRGTIDMELFVADAPLTVLNFIKLAKQGFYDGLPFHRVVPNFVVQGGDPRGDGWGGPNYHIRCEYSQRPFIRGAVGIATSGKDTGGSQFFITVTEQPHLEARYTVFGQVIAGMEVVDQIVQGDIIESIVIEEGP